MIVSKPSKGFSLLEVLVALSILTTMLIGIYQSFSTSLFLLQSTDNLWRAMSHTQQELLKWERAATSRVSITQGEFDEEHELSGFRWRLKLDDINPDPQLAVTVRIVEYTVFWEERGNEFSYSSAIYIEPK